MFKILANDDSRDRLVNSMAIAAIVLVLLTLCAFVDFITGSFSAFNTNKTTEVVTTKNSNIKTTTKE